MLALPAKPSLLTKDFVFVARLAPRFLMFDLDAKSGLVKSLKERHE
jgi:hypothetical protein